MITVLAVMVAVGLGSVMREDARTGRARVDGASAQQQKGDSGAKGRKQAPSKSEARQRSKPQRTYLVSRVVDGDTLELGNGETVRLHGIDTPEMGECGYERATAELERLALYRRVRLTGSGEDRDQYGRLLRYVDVGHKDAGLRLIQNGNAVARYDSRDGYGYHPREDAYVRADRAARNIACAEPAPVQAPRPLAGGGCAAGYKPCIPPSPPDLDCADVKGPVYVTGADPHALDGDGDGVACEWG